MKGAILKKAMTFAFLFLVALTTGAYAAVNFKRDYCENQEFLGNPRDKAPHLHCGRNFLAYKKRNGQHIQIEDRPGICGKLTMALEQFEADEQRFETPGEVSDALEAAKNDFECP